MLKRSIQFSPREYYESVHGAGSYHPAALTEAYQLMDRERLERWRAFGWIELDESTELSLWKRIWNDQGEFIEPVPSVTWDVSAAFSNDLSDLEADLTLKALANFRACTRPAERLFALDWQHRCYYFDPNKGVQNVDDESWAVPVLPDGDCYCFIGPDFRFGTLGHLSGTICVFGTDLLVAFEANKPRVFDRVIRRDGVVV